MSADAAPQYLNDCFGQGFKSRFSLARIAIPNSLGLHRIIEEIEYGSTTKSVILNICISWAKSTTLDSVVTLISLNKMLRHFSDSMLICDGKVLRVERS